MSFKINTNQMERKRKVDNVPSQLLVQLPILEFGDPYVTIESMYSDLSVAEKDLLEVTENCKTLRMNIKQQEGSLNILETRQEKLENEVSSIKAQIDLERDKLKRQHQETLKHLRDNLEKSRKQVVDL